MKRIKVIAAVVLMLCPLMSRAQSVPKAGDKFLDFTVQQDPDNPSSKVSLSDYVGKGKWVIVDFWASWCGPCRAEVPYIRKAYKNLPKDKVTVLSIAVWDEPEKSKAAIDELGMEWELIVNGGDDITDMYGIEGIPHIILFAPDGTIDKRGLRGDDIYNYTASKLQAKTQQPNKNSHNSTLNGVYKLDREQGKKPQGSNGVYKLDSELGNKAIESNNSQNSSLVSICPNGIGPIELGMTLREVKEKGLWAMYPKRKMDEFAGFPVYRMLKDDTEQAFEERVDLFLRWKEENPSEDAESLELAIDDAVVDLIMIFDKDIAISGTEICVGMSFQELLKQPGIKKIDERDFTYGNYNCRIIIGDSGTVDAIFVTTDN